jgi:hypothetical protein
MHFKKKIKKEKEKDLWLTKESIKVSFFQIDFQYSKPLDQVTEWKLMIKNAQMRH